MKAIYKYQLKTTGEQFIDFPINSEILTIQTQANIPCIWAKVETSETEHERKMFVTVGTGEPLPENTMEYVGTYQLNSGQFIFHVFEIL